LAGSLNGREIKGLPLSGGTSEVLSLEHDAEGQLLSAVTTPDSTTNVVPSAFAYGYDLAGNRTNEQRELFATPTAPLNASPTVVSKTGFNNINQLGTRTGSGSLPVHFRGTISENSTVTVNSQSAQMAITPAPGKGGGQIFTFTKSVDLSAGSQTVAVSAKDFGASGGNTTTKNYYVNVTGDVAKTYSYDNNGNCTGYTSSGGNVTYEWDAEDRLVAINQGSLRSEFTYDGLGRRVMIVEKSSGTITSTNDSFGQVPSYVRSVMATTFRSRRVAT